MTRPEKISRRKAFNKALRARAAEEQTSFASVLQRTQIVQGTRSYRSMLNLPTRPDRPTRRSMMGDNLRQRGHDAPLGNENEDDNDGGHEVLRERKNGATMVVDLMAIAKPAKVKGVAKEFEVVKRVKDVIVLEDFDVDDAFEEEDWEAIDYEDGRSETTRTYSAALRGR